MSEQFSIPLSFLQSSSPDSTEINEEFDSCIDEYIKSPVFACTKMESLKLLKSFGKAEFHDFWTTSAAKYLPAVSEGTMKLCEKRLPHDKAVEYARDLISRMSPATLSRDFLYSVAHNAPEYRTALACYYYVKNLPDHEFEHYYIGQDLNRNGEWIDRYNETACEICLYDHGNRAEKKMDFWHINTVMYFFYFTASIPHFSLNTAIIYLEEYNRLPRPNHSDADSEVFEDLLRLIENSPENTSPGKLRGIIRKSGLTKMSVAETDAFIDMLGYLNILHPDDCFGVTHGHTLLHNQKDGLSSRGYAAYPVNRWCGKYGVDRESTDLLFGGIYKKV